MMSTVSFFLTKVSVSRRFCSSGVGCRVIMLSSCGQCHPIHIEIHNPNRWTMDVLIPCFRRSATNALMNEPEYADRGDMLLVLGDLQFNASDNQHTKDLQSG